MYGETVKNRHVYVHMNHLRKNSYYIIS